MQEERLINSMTQAPLGAVGVDARTDATVGCDYNIVGVRSRSVTACVSSPVDCAGFRARFASD